MSDEEKRLLIECKLSEYREVRTEMRDVHRQQFTILTLFVTAIGIVFNFLPEAEETIPFIGLCLIPGMAAFFGVLWIDQVLRMVCISNFLYDLESDVNNIINYSRDFSTKSLFFEHACSSVNEPTMSRGIRILSSKYETEAIGKIFNPHLFYYYLGLGLFITVPLLSCQLVNQLGFFRVDYNIKLGGLFYILFILFTIQDVRIIVHKRA